MPRLPALTSGFTSHWQLAGLMAVLALLGQQAQAQGLPDSRRPGMRSTTLQSPAAARCARYGEGFVPVQGSDGCVKIGGRLRIDLGSAAPASVTSGGGSGFSNAAHIRLPGR